MQALPAGPVRDPAAAHPDPAIATGRDHSLFEADWQARAGAIAGRIAGASILVAGGAGTIGSAVVAALLPFRPARIHVIDIDENGLARLARRLREEGDTDVELAFLAADIGGYPAAAHCAAAGRFDLVLDFAAVKHVRSEKSVPALLHLLAVNVVRQDRFLRMLVEDAEARRCLAVSTDKAADPASFMGASKRVLEEVIYATGRRAGFPTVTARFANVAFSSGSLLESFVERMVRRQPLAAPRDTRRFFLSTGEAAQICLLAIAEDKADTLVPRLAAGRHLVTLDEVARRFVAACGREAVMVETLAEAKAVIADGNRSRAYPVILTPRDTVGEKAEEVLAGDGERPFEIGLSMLQGLAVPHAAPDEVAEVVSALAERVEGRVATCDTGEIAAILRRIVPNFAHRSGSAHLDDRV